MSSFSNNNNNGKSNSIYNQPPVLGYNNNLKVILITVVSTALITSVIVGFSVFFLAKGTSNSISTLLGLEERNKAQQDDLSKNFDVSKNEEYLDSDIAAFYSVYFDTMFFYPKKKNFFLYETPEGINVGLNSASSLSESALITMSESKDLQGYISMYTNFKGKDLGNKVKIKNELVANAYRIDFDYSDAVKEKLLPSYHYKQKVVLYRNLNNGKDIVLEYNGINVDNYIGDLLYLINSFKFSPENVERIVRFDFGVNNFYVDMNRILWINTPSDQSRLFLKFFFNRNFEKELFNKHDSVLNIVYTMINNPTAPESMKTAVDKSLNYYKNSVYKAATVVTPVTKKTISGKNAYDFTISYTNEKGQIEEFYYALIDTNHGFFVAVEFSYPSKNSNAYAEFNNVMENLKFD